MPSAKKMQQITEQPPAAEQKIRLTVWMDTAFHFALELPARAVCDLLDPDVPDAFIEVPVGSLDDNPQRSGSVKATYLHTSRIARIDLHDALPQPETEKPQTEKRGG